MNSAKLKNMIFKKANGNSDISQKFYQLFYFERILERISVSPYRGQIILKGGLLLTFIIGDDERTTKDMDATLKGIPLTKNDVEKIFHKILEIDIGDGVTFQIMSVKDIRLEDEYGGFRLTILSKLDNNKTYVIIELTTGDAITPKEIKYNYNCIFENKKIPIMSYPLETVVSEKFHSIISRGVLNTRMKDFYDVYILINIKFDEINKKDLIKAIQNTFKRRETICDVDRFTDIMNELVHDNTIKHLWKEYVSKNPYAENITFDDTLKALEKIMALLKN